MPIYPVYIVDDDPGIHAWARNLCEERGLACRAFADGEEFLAAAADLDPGCVLLDMRMPRTSGIEVQAELARRGIAMPVIAITGYGDVGVAVQSMKLGALDFLEKPFSQELLAAALDEAFAILARPPVPT